LNLEASTIIPNTAWHRFQFFALSLIFAPQLYLNSSVWHCMADAIANACIKFAGELLANIGALDRRLH
jgi:hypothetical protein